MSTTVVHSSKTAPLSFDLWTTSLLGESFSDDLIRQFDVRRSLLYSEDAASKVRHQNVLRLQNHCVSAEVGFKDTQR